jgi:hypothetical protein
MSGPLSAQYRRCDVPKDDSMERLARDLAEAHRPRLERDPFAENGDYYSVRCRSCDGIRGRIILLGTDPVPECRFWIRAKALGLVEDNRS